MTVRRFLSCIRYRDILMLQGAPLLGAAFSMGAPSARRLAAAAVFAAASVLLVAHIFVFNDWAGVDADLNDSNKIAGVFATKGISRRAVGWLAAALLAVSLALFALLGPRPLGIALAVAACGVLYSLPAAPAKSIPMLSSLVHLAGGGMHFLLGAALFGPLDGRDAALALFFGLSFAAGHLNQEVRDFDGDLRNGIETNAVAFGKRAAFLAGLTLFTFAYALLTLLALYGALPRGLAALGLLYPLHLYWSLKTLGEGLSFASIGRLQKRYHALYAVVGAAMLAALLMRPAPAARAGAGVRDGGGLEARR